MKINELFVLRQVVDTWVVMPISSALINMDGMMILNETGAFLWKELMQERTQSDLVNALCNEYNVDREKASNDVACFIKKLSDHGCLML